MKKLNHILLKKIRLISLIHFFTLSLIHFPAVAAPSMPATVNTIIDGNTIYVSATPRGTDATINTIVKILGAPADTPHDSRLTLYELIPPGTRIWMTRINDAQGTGTISARVWRDGKNVGEYIQSQN